MFRLNFRTLNERFPLTNPTAEYRSQFTINSSAEGFTICLADRANDIAAISIERDELVALHNLIGAALDDGYQRDFDAEAAAANEALAPVDDWAAELNAQGL